MKKGIVLMALLATALASAQINIDRTGGLIFAGYPTTELDALSNPRKGMVVRDSTLNMLVYYDGTAFVTLGGAGNVTGPASSTDNAIARFDSTTGKIIQNSGTTLSDAGILTMAGGINSQAIYPDADDTRSIGTSSNRYVSVYSKQFIFNPLASDPTFVPNLGQTFYRSDLGKISFWDGSSIQRLAIESDLTDLSTSKLDSIVQDLTPELGGNLDAGGYNISNLDTINGVEFQVNTRLNIPVITGDPSSYVKGDIWYNDTANEYRASNDAGDGVVTFGALTDSGQTKTYETGSSETLTLSSFLDSGSLTGRGKVVTHTANDTITTATGLGQTGRYISALHLLNGADSVYVKKGSGSTLINRTIAYNGSGVSEDGIWATTDFMLSLRPDGAIEVDGSDTFLAHTEVTDAMLHANLAIRLDETSIDATAVSEGDPVGTWTDVVSGHNATSSGANRPSLHIVSGQRTVSFDGTDEFLGIAAANVNYTSGDVVTIMIELADIVPDNNVGTNYILSKGGFNQTTTHQYTIWSSGNVTRFNAFGNPATTSTDFTTNMVLTLNIKATTFDAWMNGTKVITDQALTNSATFSADLILGGNNAGLDNNGTFSMQGMYIYEGGLNDTEITDRVTYLNSN